MARHLVTSFYRTDQAQAFIDAVAQQNNQFYTFTGAHVPFVGGVIPAPYDDVYDTVIDVYRTMLFGKLVKPADTKLMVPRYDYTYGTTYAKYNDSDPLIFDKQFYAVVNADAYFHVWKCLDNNRDSPSTIQPNIGDIDPDDTSYRTSDGYVWKYMYTVDASTVSKFSTNKWFPVIANTTVQSKAVAGAIDMIETIESGNGYSNYFEGTFSISDIALNGNNLLYAINSTASSVANYYTGCIVYITADPLGNSAGQARKILGYSVNATTKWIQLDSPFDFQPKNGAQYQINPGVVITSDGTQSENAVAWAVVNASTNSINHVQVLKRGADYKYAEAYVYAANAVGVTTVAEIRPIYSPPGGHGYDPGAELGASAVCVSVSFSNTESNAIFVNTAYQRIGILKNPLFADIGLTLSNATGIFIAGETVHAVQPVLLKATCNTSTTNTYVQAADADFFNQLSANDRVILYDGVSYQLNTVNTVSNSTQVILNANAHVTSASVSMYKTTIIASAETTGVGFSSLQIDDLDHPIAIGDLIIGETSGAFAVVDEIKRSNTAKSFDTFIGCYHYTGSMTVGAFSNNEYVTQDLAHGRIASQSANGSEIYVTDQRGVFDVANTIVGNTSGAVFSVTTKYQPEIKFASGDVTYVENIYAINRTQTRSEQFKLILTF